MVHKGWYVGVVCDEPTPTVYKPWSCSFVEHWFRLPKKVQSTPRPAPQERSSSSQKPHIITIKATGKMNRLPLRLSIPHEQAADGNRTPNVADQPQEDSTPLSPYPPPPIGVYHQPTGMDLRLAPGSSGGPTSHPGETEYPQAPVHPANTGPGSNIDFLNTEARRFSLLGRLFTPGDLGKVIYEHAAKSNRVDIRKREIAARFRDQLKSLADHLEEFKEGYQFSRNIPEARAEMESCIDQWEYLSLRVQELVRVCEEAMQTIPLHEDGTYTQQAWDEFMKTFLGVVHHVPAATQEIMTDMEMLIEYYEQDGMQALNRLRSQLMV